MAVSRTTTIFNAATAHPVTMPAAVNPGDLLIALLSFSKTTVSTPANWNLLHKTDHATGDVSAAAFYKIAVGTEDGTTVDFVTAGSDDMVAHVLCYTSWHGTTPPEVGTAVTASTASVNPPSVAPSWGSEPGNEWAFHFGTVNPRTVNTWSTNYTTNGQIDASPTGAPQVSGASSWRANDAATEDPGVTTINSTADIVVNTIAIRPAAAPPGVGGSNMLLLGVG